MGELVLGYKVIKKTTVVNSKVLKCPCNAVINYSNILCPVELEH
jgi:hypothetical protein